MNIVLASKGYPESFEKGHPIKINPELFQDEKLLIFYAGVNYDSKNKTLTNNGGRVLGVTCLENSFKNAREYVYSKLSEITSDILRYRYDIGKRNEV